MTDSGPDCGTGSGLLIDPVKYSDKEQFNVFSWLLFSCFANYNVKNLSYLSYIFVFGTAKLQHRSYNFGVSIKVLTGRLYTFIQSFFVARQLILVACVTHKRQPGVLGITNGADEKLIALSNMQQTRKKRLSYAAPFSL